MRRFLLACVIVLAACSPGDEAQVQGEAAFCAIGGAKQFTNTCRIERTTLGNAQVIVVRHPDGGFHRLEVSADGQNLLAVDGARQSQSARKGDRYEVILGEDRYVIPVNPAGEASDAAS